MKATGDYDMEKVIKKLRSKRAGMLLAGAILLGVFFFGTLSVSAEDNFEAFGMSDFEISATGEKNAAKDCYEVTVDVKPLKRDVSGKVQLLVYFSSSSAVYETEASLPKGNTKQVKFTIPAKWVQSNQDNRINTFVSVTTGGKRLCKFEVDPADLFLEAGMTGLKVGLLSDDPGRLKWMDMGGNSVYISGRDMQVALTGLEQDFDENDIGHLDYLVVDDVDLSTLKSDQIDAIKSWTNGGGGLILGTGPRAESVSGLGTDFLDASVAIPGEESTRYTAIDFGSSYVEENTSYGSLMIKPCQNGAIVLAPFSWGDLGSESTTSPLLGEMVYRDRDYVVRETYERLASYVGITNYNTSIVDYNMKDTFAYLEKDISPDFGLLRLVVLLYVAFIGPVLYLLLKKKGKRETIWAWIPAVSAAFLVLVFLVGSRQRIGGVNLQSVSVMQADGKGGARSYLYGFSPGHSKWSETLAEGYHMAMPYISDYGSEEKPYYFTKDARGYHIGYNPKSSFEDVMMLAYGQNKESGSLEWEAESDYAGVMKGQVVNHTGHDLYYVLVVWNGYAYLMKDIKNGESVSLSDATHIEERGLRFDDADNLRTYLSDYYYDNKKEQARYLAALTIATYDIYKMDNLEYCIGVTEDDTDVFKSRVTGENLTCLYSERSIYDY